LTLGDDMASDVKVPGGREAAINPLRPLFAASRALAVLVLGVLGAGTVAAVLGGGSVLTIGDDPICTTVSAGVEVPLRGDMPVGYTSWGLAARVNPMEHQYQLCQDRPGGTAQVMSFLTLAPGMVLLLGFLAGVLLVARQARRFGLFSRQVARVVHWLGWYFIAGALLASTVTALATSALVRQMLPGHNLWGFSAYWHVSISTLLAGAGLLTIARVLRLSAEMQEDLDATI
jgi:hypothetical protein